MYNQTQLFTTERATALVDRLWQRYAIKECLAYGSHGEYTEQVAGARICADCRQVV
jgi:hypothetical protein